jgi:hypothetical protein
MSYNVYMGDDIRIGYKVVEVIGGKVMSLFHGTNHSRVIPLGIWYRSRSELVSDGMGGRLYQSGWHYFDSEGGAREFFGTLRVKTDRYIVRCCARGNIRLKWSGKCMLADEIMIRVEDVGGQTDGEEDVS